MPDDQFNHSLAALRFARIANGVSQLHGEVSRSMWSKYDNIARLFPLPMRKTGVTGPISNCTVLKKKTTMLALMTGKIG